MIPAWAAALIITLAIEVPVVAWFYPGQRRKMAVVASLSTTVTNLLMNLVLNNVRCFIGQHVLIGEVIALVAEASAYAVMSRPHDLPRAVFVSSLANALSFTAGFSPVLVQLFE